MVIGAFPLAKLAVLLIKQISKPIANMCKERAKSHPFFRAYVCMPPAQFYNWCEVKAKMWILNLGKPVNIPVLNQNMAIELGANLLGEGVIFGIGASLLIFEYNRQSKKESAKEEKRLKDLGHVTNTIRDLYFTLQQQEAQLLEMERVLLNLTSDTPVNVPPVPPEFGKDKGILAKLRRYIGLVPAAPSTIASPPKARPVSHSREDNIVFFTTPYPDRGIILQALNYVQMDVLNTSFVSDATVEPELSQNYTHRRDKGVVNEALDNIENELKSLF